MTVKGTQKLKSRELKFILPSNLSKRPRDQKNLTLSVFDGSTCALCDVSPCNLVTILKLHISAHWIQMGSKPHLRVKIQWFFYRLGFCRMLERQKYFPSTVLKSRKNRIPGIWDRLCILGLLSGGSYIGVVVAAALWGVMQILHPSHFRVWGNKGRGGSLCVANSDMSSLNWSRF